MIWSGLEFEKEADIGAPVRERSPFPVFISLIIETRIL